MSPLDMLNLSRSSKSMRAILSSKKLSKHAWVAARKNIVPALPDCPDFISEMAYAHVLFEHSCEVGVVRPPRNIRSDELCLLSIRHAMLLGLGMRSTRFRCGSASNVWKRSKYKSSNAHLRPRAERFCSVGTGTELMKRYKIPEHRVRLIALFCPLYPRSSKCIS